ncbi:uncharacterized protein [Spinacia oleracea]|uniref:Reverse transcriptase domain-containing protein n=1 Tax=Spinacia oleracea TaxID=3562 RepID=A0ABM3R8G0_SPIOL|nr:uncharacterized protein LOC110790257 [Spinacia oleracea]
MVHQEIFPNEISELIPKLSDQQIRNLDNDIAEWEIKQAIFQMGGLKAPGPDGIPAVFYQKQWNIVGKEVTEAVLHFFRTGYLLREWNKTLIALIPKISSPEKANQFRPIGLCNVIYKIISKCITNRLKPIMQQIVGPFQNAFVPRRFMGDNCLLAHEVMTYIKRKKKGLERFAVLKVDMNKAYDRVRWDFVHWLLDVMNFPPRWRHWIMQCITTTSYSILINNEPSDFFKPQCGLRQGDPISPYIFILVMEVLSRMMLKLEATGQIKGIKFSRNSPSISHMFFADDSLFRFKANQKSCKNIRDTIDLFCKISGEAINFDKSSVIFSPNTPSPVKNDLKQVLGTPCTEKLGRYLGCDVEIDGRSVKSFQPLVDKIQKKVISWKHLSLSQAGRLIFINSILAALCSNVLTVFRVPKKIADQINSKFMRFWWKGSSDDKAIRIHNNPSLLIAQVFSVVYKKSPVEAGLTADIHHKASWGYRGLCKSVRDAENGFGKTVYKGDTDINQSNWLPSKKVQIKDQNNIERNRISKVKDLFSEDAKNWNANLVWKSFSCETAKEILALHIPQEDRDDQFHWMNSNKESSIVKSVYNFLLLGNSGQNFSERERFWGMLWKSDLLPKWKVFIWKIMHRAIAVKARLRKRGMDVDGVCCLCKSQEENEDHLFRDCPVANHVWKSSPLGIVVQNNQHVEVRNWIRNFLTYFWKEDGHDSTRSKVFIVVLWAIWLQRNEVTFRKAEVNPMRIMHSIRKHINQAMEAERMVQIMKRDNAIRCGEQRQSKSHIIIKDNFGIAPCDLIVAGYWKRVKKKKYAIALASWIILRNNKEVAKNVQRVEAIDACQAELKAVLLAVQHAYSTHIRSARVCTSRAGVVSNIRNFPVCRFDLVTLIGDIMNISGKLDGCSIEECSKDQTLKARELAAEFRKKCF